VVTKVEEIYSNALKTPKIRHKAAPLLKAVYPFGQGGMGQIDLKS